MQIDSLFNNVYHENKNIILNLVKKQSDGKILDCGCGDGAFTLELAQKMETSQIYGIEYIEELAQEAGNKAIIVYKSNLNEKFPIVDSTFDVVHANQIIEHLVETDLFVKEIYRIMKTPGYAIISTPNLASMHNIFSLILGKQPFSAHASNEYILGNTFDPKHGKKHGNRGSIHLRVFTYEALKELSEQYGFKVEKIIGVGYYPFPNWIGRFVSALDKKHSAYLTIKVSK
jgi:2-polyprenyl-3-methyl-5-hydroxy-6-metoxy-1,4-benzoquinol methylase